MEEKTPTSTFRNTVWPSVKPFVNGGLAQLLPVGATYSLIFLYYRLNISRSWLYISQGKSFNFFKGGISSATLLGSYEVLTRKVEALNEGSPLTLYQETGCGLASGAIRSFICFPLARGHVGIRHVFSAITQVIRNEGVFALWKGASPVAISTMLASNTGMLVSYDRSRIYLKETYGLEEYDARFGAGIFSGICTGACYMTTLFAAVVICKLRAHRVKFPHYVSVVLRTLKPGAQFNFYSELLKECAHSSPGVALMWVFLERIRDAEESIGL